MSTKHTPLVWHDNTKDGEFADTELGVVAAIKSPRGDYWWACWDGVTVDHIKHTTRHAAKVAAEAHYRRVEA